MSLKAIILEGITSTTINHFQVMISKDKTSKLVKMYCYICNLYEKELQHSIMRFSNNDQPVFTDQEAMCIYLFAMKEEKRFQKWEN